FKQCTTREHDVIALTITFDPTKYKLLNTTYDFVGDLKSVNDSALASGRLVVSAVSSSQKIPATTALGTLNFQTLVPGPLILGVSRLNVNGFSYVTDSGPLTLNSTSGTSGGGTTDTTPPQLSSSDPQQNATVSPTKEFLTLNFNEAVVLGTGTIQLKTAAGVVVESFDVASSTRVVRNGSTITIDPVNNLATGTTPSLNQRKPKGGSDRNARTYQILWCSAGVAKNLRRSMQKSIIPYSSLSSTIQSLQARGAKILSITNI
ncbi:MAG: hypothetical protein EBS91_11820, partial [Betaproteobacteria bacterium]|nr:hypothetical protein [Betaproteobacteria bacterium]